MTAQDSTALVQQYRDRLNALKDRRSKEHTLIEVCPFHVIFEKMPLADRSTLQGLIEQLERSESHCEEVSLLLRQREYELDEAWDELNELHDSQQAGSDSPLEAGSEESRIQGFEHTVSSFKEETRLPTMLMTICRRFINPP